MANKKCPVCKKQFENVSDVALHLETEHGDEIPNDWSGGKYYFYRLHGRTTGKCTVCGHETEFDEVTCKTKRLCKNPACKKKFIDNFKNNMKRAGKENQMKDPNHQKKMLQGRSLAKEYKWSDGGKSICIGSYEYDAAQFLDIFLGLSSDDVMFPAPMTIEYEFNGEKHFYIPDIYIVSLNLIIEIKDGGDNPNTHPKILAVDKKKERAKELALKNYDYNYIKISDKKYGKFVSLFKELCNMDNISKPGTYKPIIMLDEQALLEHMCGGDIIERKSIFYCSFKSMKNVDCISYGVGIDKDLFYIEGDVLQHATSDTVSELTTIRSNTLNNITDIDKKFILDSLLERVGNTFDIQDSTRISQDKTLNKFLIGEDIICIVYDLFKVDNKETPQLSESFGKVKLYHGSATKFKTLKPLGFDLGNALQGPGWSTFCWRSEEKAKVWAVFQLARKIRKEKKDKNIELIWDFRNDIVLVTQDTYENISNNYLGNKAYVYSFEMPISKVSLGNDSTIDEYTIRDEVVPDNINTIVFNRADLSKYFKIVDQSEIDKFGREYMSGKYLGRRGLIKSSLITSDFSNQWSSDALRKINIALQNGDLQPGDDFSQFLTDNNIKIKKTYFPERIKQRLSESFDAVDIQSELVALNSLRNKIYASYSVNNYSLNEAITFSNKLIEHNVEEWIDGEKNILFITGLSGSGKSTLARQYADEYNATHIEMDLVEQGKKTLLYNELCEKLPFYSTWSKEGKDTNHEDYSSNMNKIIDTSIHLLKQRDGKFILEGIQFYYYKNKNNLKDEPIIVIDSSILKSARQRLRRSMKKGDKIKTNDLIPMLRWYMNDDKMKDDFVKEVIRESTTNYIYLHENETEDYFNEKVTLYHGSNLKLDKILPTSMNLGSKVSGSRNSSFWVHGDSLDFAYAFAVLRAINSQGTDVTYTFGFNKAKKITKSRLIVDEKFKDSIVKGVHGFIYSKEFDLVDVNRGHDINLPEFTIDFNVIPDDCQEIRFDDVKHMVSFKSAEYINNIRESIKRGELEYEEFSTNDPLKDVLFKFDDNFDKRYENKLEESTVYDPSIELLKDNRLKYKELCECKFTEIGELDLNVELLREVYCVNFDTKYNSILSRIQKANKENYIPLELLEERESYIRNLDETTTLEEMAYLCMVTSLSDY